MYETSGEVRSRFVVAQGRGAGAASHPFLDTSRYCSTALTSRALAIAIAPGVTDPAAEQVETEKHAVDLKGLRDGGGALVTWVLTGTSEVEVGEVGEGVVVTFRVLAIALVPSTLILCAVARSHAAVSAHASGISGCEPDQGDCGGRSYRFGAIPGRDASI